MSCRETVLSCLSQQPHLRRIVNINSSDSRLVEVQTTLLSSCLSRAHGQLQESLTSATYLASLIEPCQALGLNIEAAAQLEAANALWEQGEMTSSIGMLQALEKNSILKKQTIPIGRPDLLAKIGYQVSVARLEKPDRIIEKYLLPALKELKGKADGDEAGQVFHEFAVFCDQQLQDADGLEDLTRLRKLKEMKASEVYELGKMVKSATSSEQKAKYHGHLVKAKQWLQLDTEEYRRLSASKDELLRQSLENYLLSLTASDGHNNDALRFTALWLEHSKEDIAMDSVSKYLGNVPSRKFSSLMNQLTSRLLNNADRFQQILFSLILRICVEHPYHGMYQIWAGCRSKSNSKDETAVSRQAATNKVAQDIASNSKSAKTWTAISKTSAVYCQLAAERDETRYKAGQKIQLKDSHSGTSLNNLLPKYLTPPPTLQVDIAADLDYSKVPVMQRLEPQISIASGVSAPKIITVIASDGSKYKQLVRNSDSYWMFHS
jgi:serine-protein kinase ATM